MSVNLSLQQIFVSVNSATIGSAVNWIAIEAKTPNPTASITAYCSVCIARSGLSAPMFCAPSAETVESIEEGIKNRKLITFSTIPTAAASFSPRWLAIIVITINAIWIKPSWKAMGTPIYHKAFARSMKAGTAARTKWHFWICYLLLNSFPQFKSLLAYSI